MISFACWDISNRIIHCFVTTIRPWSLQVRARAADLNLSPTSDINLLESRDIHIHFPAGAVPKDGPSAGVTLVTALVIMQRWSGRATILMTKNSTLLRVPHSCMLLVACYKPNLLRGRQGDRLSPHAWVTKLWRFRGRSRAQGMQFQPTKLVGDEQALF